MTGEQKKSRRGSRRFQGSGTLYGDLLIVTHSILGQVRLNVALGEEFLVIGSGGLGKRATNVLQEIQTRLCAGQALHEAMEALPKFFPKYYVDLVRIGEETGTLEECLSGVERELSRSAEARGDTAAALTYPVVAGGFLLIIAMGLFVFMVPKFVQIISAMEAEIGPVMTTTIAISDAARSWQVLPLIAALIFFLTALTKANQWKAGNRARWVGRVFLLLPFLRGIEAKGNLARAAYVLELLLGAGMPLHKALDNVARLDINPVIANAFGEAGKSVEQGLTLREAMDSQRRVLPASFRDLVALGETGGSLPQSFGHLAAYNRDEASRSAQIFTAALEPFLIGIMGIPVYLVYASIFETFSMLPRLPFP